LLCPRIKGKKLTEMMEPEELDETGEDEEFQIVVSADGSPLCRRQRRSRRGLARR